LNYLSVCSGIEAATVAWHHMGWKPIGFSEIEKFPSQVLQHHYPNVPNLGDMTKYKEWNLNAPIDVLVGGTPCQSFSVAGLRKGLEDPRGNLMLTYVGILDKFRPKWCVWENVPGVLSSNGGKDFGSFLSALVELGYGWAYRVLDAQYFGVAQRRRRVFVVGCFGNWRSAAEVLFESESLQRHIKPSREKGQKTTYGIANCVGALCARDYKGISADNVGEGKVILPNVFYENHGTDSRIKEIDVSPTVTARWGTGGNNVPLTQPISFDLAQITSKQNGTKVEPGLPVSTLAKGSQMHCAYSLQGAGSTSQNANGDGYKEEQSYTLNRTDIHGVAILGGQHPNASIGENLSPTLTSAMGTGGGHVPVVGNVANVHAFKVRGGCDGGGKGYLGQDEKAFTLSTTQDQQIFTQNTRNEVRYINGDGQIAGALMAQSGMKQQNYLHQNMAVRRLTPIECERLQGFPDNYTNIKDNCPDGPRYKALGNSMAVPVMKWIGERINDKS
jgi:DNA (cytosine-5)-methyltransferase 1